MRRRGKAADTRGFTREMSRLILLEPVISLETPPQLADDVRSSLVSWITTMFSPLSRRSLLSRIGCGFGSLALADLVSREAVADPSAGKPTSPLAAKQTHHPARAKRIIFIFMQGGPSQVDTYDPKSELDKHDGEKIEFFNSRRRKVQAERVQKSPWKFQQYGESGRPVSSLFPHMARHVDDYCVVRSMHTNGVAHGPATLFLHTGAMNLIRPSMGSWVSYGLGTENDNLPAYITLHPPASKGGPRNYSNSFLPALYQGTAIGRAGVPVGEASIRHIQNTTLTKEQQRKQFEYLQALNREQVGSSGDDQLEATVESFELAWRMQMHAPEVLDLSRETKETQSRYGIDQSATKDYGRMCLLARRMCEAGVRFVQVNYADNAPTPRWPSRCSRRVRWPAACCRFVHCRTAAALASSGKSQIPTTSPTHALYPGALQPDALLGPGLHTRR